MRLSRLLTSPSVACDLSRSAHPGQRVIADLGAFRMDRENREIGSYFRPLAYQQDRRHIAAPHLVGHRTPSETYQAVTPLGGHHHLLAARYRLPLQALPNRLKVAFRFRPLRRGADHPQQADLSHYLATDQLLHQSEGRLGMS